MIRNEAGNHSLKLLCKLLNVSRAGYYTFRHGPPSQTALRHQWLTGEIKRVFDEHKSRYGSPRIARQLYEEGIETNKRTVAMLMQRAGLVSLYSRKRRKKQHHASKEGVLHDNLLKRDVNSSEPGMVFVTDITYVPCSDGRLYLTPYLDLATRLPKSYGSTDHMRKSCVIEPLKRLLPQGDVKQGAITHSDQGSQYRSYAFAALCEENSLRQSMSEAGKPIDNAVAEAFFKTVKTEVIKPNRHLTKAQMEVILRNYLDDDYPNKRIHTTLGMTPLQYEQQLLAKMVT